MHSIGVKAGRAGGAFFLNSQGTCKFSREKKEVAIWELFLLPLASLGTGSGSFFVHSPHGQGAVNLLYGRKANWRCGCLTQTWLMKVLLGSAGFFLGPHCSLCNIALIGAYQARTVVLVVDSGWICRMPLHLHPSPRRGDMSHFQIRIPLAAHHRIKWALIFCGAVGD